MFCDKWAKAKHDCQTSVTPPPLRDQAEWSQNKIISVKQHFSKAFFHALFILLESDAEQGYKSTQVGLADLAQLYNPVITRLLSGLASELTGYNPTRTP